MRDLRKEIKNQVQLSQQRHHQLDLLLNLQLFHVQTPESWKVMKELNLLQASWIQHSAQKEQTLRLLKSVIKYKKRLMPLLLNKWTHNIWQLNAYHQFQKAIMGLLCKTILRTQERINLSLQMMLMSRVPIQATWESQMDVFSTIEYDIQKC